MFPEQTKRFWIDAALFAGFFACFFLDLTGVSVHQWVGVWAGALAAYHLSAHWNWVDAVSGRFFAKGSARSRLFFLIDAALWLGFTVIIYTGLVISTWLKLSLWNETTWLTIHIAASITTLCALLVKIGLHSRWILAAGKKLFQPSPRTGKLSPALATSPVRTDRRAFLKLMGMVSVAALFAVGKSVQGLANSLALAGETTSSLSTEDSLSASSGADGVASASAGASLSSQSAAAASSSGSTSSSPGPSQGNGFSSSPTAAWTVVSTPTPAAKSSANSAASCVLRCNRRCSYPGHCRRYTDSNNTGRCDFGECLS